MARILVIRGGAIGDFILTLPTIQLLRTELPEKPHLEILGYPSIANLAVEFGFAEAVRSIDRGPMAGFFVPNGTLDAELKEYFASFNLVLSYFYDPDTFFTRNLERAGARSVLRGDHRVQDGTGVPAAAQLAKPVEQLALFLEKPYVSFPGLGTAGKTVAIHPGSGSSRKNWGYENWAAVAKDLAAARPDFELLVVSGEAEESTIGDFLGLLRDAEVAYRHLAGTPLPSLARRLAECRLFLGHDSGISHLAAAAGVPCHLVFGPTDPAVWAPQNPGVNVLRSPGGDLSRLARRTVLEAALGTIS